MPLRRAPRATLPRCIALVVASVLLAPHGALHAQERLVGQRSLGASTTFDVVSFAGDGLLQRAFAGQGAYRVKRVQQLTIPVSTTVPLSKGWTLDATTLFASGTITFDDVAGATDRKATLSGISDVRVRASGHLFSDGVLLTIGMNAPTGKTKLDSTGLVALRALAAPALALGSTPVGTGPSGTIGLLGLREIGAWSVAMGASYEYRGTFQPITALVSGAPRTDFVPGGVVRASLGVDRVLGANRFSLTTSADLFAEDRLRTSNAASGGGDGTLARVHLGPLVSTDAELHLAAPHAREVLLWAAHRWRSAFAREGVTVSGTSGQYVDGGTSIVFPLSGQLSLTTSLTGRWHSGLAIDEGLPTAGVRSGALSIGLSQRTGNLNWQPFARVQAGRVQARGDARETEQASFTAASFGLVVVSRF